MSTVELPSRRPKSANVNLADASLGRPMVRKRIVITFATMILVLIAVIVVFVARSNEPRGTSLLPGEKGLSGATPTAPLEVTPFNNDVRTVPENPNHAQGHAETAPSSLGRATIRGRLINQNSDPVTGSILLQVGKRTIKRCTVNAQGLFEFFGLASETYRLEVDQESLPSGYLAPWRQDVEVANNMVGMYATVIRVPAGGGEFEVDLMVCAGSTVFGYVFGPDGEKADGVFVELNNADLDRENLDVDGQTDGDGFYKLTLVYPGRYRVGVVMESSHRLATLPAPKLEEVLVPPGVSIQVDVHIARGPCAIDGVVVDQDGNPVEGVDVISFYWTDPGELLPNTKPFNWGDSVGTAVTDADGKFALDNLPLEKLRVLVGAKASARARNGQPRLLERWAEPREFDLRTPGERLMTRWVVKRSMPFALRGSVSVDAGWAATNAFERRSIRIAIKTTVPPGEDIDVRVDAQGEFEWDCETPSDPVRLIVSDSKGRFSPKEFLIFPEPLKTMKLDISIP